MVSIFQSCFSRCDSIGTVVAFISGVGENKAHSFFEHSLVHNNNNDKVDCIKISECEASIKSFNFSHNNMIRNSGFVLLPGSVTCSYSTFSNNIQEGSLNYGRTSSAAIISCCNFVNNQQTKNGQYEGILMLIDNSICHVFKCAFSHNTGVTMKIASSQAIMSYCYFDSPVTGSGVSFHKTIITSFSINLSKLRYHCDEIKATLPVVKKAKNLGIASLFFISINKNPV